MPLRTCGSVCTTSASVGGGAGVVPGLGELSSEDLGFIL